MGTSVTWAKTESPLLLAKEVAAVAPRLAVQQSAVRPRRGEPLEAPADPGAAVEKVEAAGSPGDRALLSLSGIS